MDFIQHTAGAGPLSDFTVGQKVTTKEGYSGTITDILEGPMNLTTVWVDLDGGMGGGEYAEAEIQPLDEPTTASRIAAEVERTAASDYPELGTILSDRLPPEINRRTASKRTAAAAVLCQYCGDQYFIDTPGESHGCDRDPGTRTALNLTDVTPRSNTLPKGITEAQAAGYREGREHASSGAVTREPSNVEDPDFTAGYQLGWADGIAGPSGNIPGNWTTELEKAQTGATKSETPLGAFEAAGLREWFQENAVPGKPLSYDWCRFRRSSQCWLPWSLNEQATAQQGYAVWNPMNRGSCWRDSWDEQRACSTSAPGPNANGYTDATRSWEEGGQRNGQPTSEPVDPNKYTRNTRPGGVVNVASIQTEAALFSEYSDKEMAYYAENTPKGEKPHIMERDSALVALLRGVPVGQLTYTEEQDPNAYADDDFVGTIKGDYNGYYLRVDVLAVDKAFRRRGIAKALMDHFAQYADRVYGRGVKGGGWDPGEFTADGAAFWKSYSGKSVPVTQRSTYSSLQVEASWRDVQAKAKRIRQSGHVRVIASKDNVLVGHVRGDNGVYETEIMSHPGRKNAATWACGCKWASYSWGRSGPWKRFEGRMCSHALALQYEAQSRGWGGKTITLDSEEPSWMSDSKVYQHGDYSKDKGRYASAGRPTLFSLAGPIDDLLRSKLRGATTLEQAAQIMLSVARREEPKVVSDLSGLAAGAHGEFVGLEHRLKGEGSLLRKMRDEKIVTQTPGEVAMNMSDTLRFTILFAPENYAEGSKRILSGMQSKGYTCRTKNYWRRGDAYNGINVAMTTPGGHPVEVQFHTEESFKAKEQVNHPLYEEWRTTTDENRKAQIGYQMMMNSDSVRRPPGATSIGDMKRQPRAPYSQINWFPGKTSAYFTAEDLLDNVYKYLAVHLIDDNPDTPEIIGLVRVSPAGAWIWEGGAWTQRDEFAKWYFLGTVNAEEVDLEEASAIADALDNPPFADIPEED